jgi:acetylornithine deacetylase
MDTVPPFTLPAKMKFIYGRGACDAKGIIVAQIAAEKLRAGGITEIGLLFTLMKK